MAAPNEESQQPEGLATGSQQEAEGSIAAGIMKDVMEEQAIQDLNAKLETLESELARERKEKEEAIASKNQLGTHLRFSVMALLSSSSDSLYYLIAVVNAQLEEANKRAQASFVSTSGTLREYETRIEVSSSDL